MASKARQPRVFMLDLWSTVPYYTAYLSRALRSAGAAVQVGAITYYLDRQCFAGRGLRLQPGLCDVVGRLDLPRTPRRLLKLAEGAANLLALTLRFAVSPPQVVHIQFLPLLRSRLPLDHWFTRFCQLRGARLVLTVHDLMPHDTGEQHRATYARLYAEMDGLICHSIHILKRLTAEFGVPEAKVSVIPHGPFFYDLQISDASRYSSAEQAVTVLWQGILFPYKGVDLLLNAWQRVERAAPKARLRILGTGDPELLNSLQEHAKQLQLRAVDFDLRFCSAEELVAAYQQAAVVVYPYRAITTSGALATGLALGKAIVASDLPVFRELLSEGENALLVDPERPEELAAALIRLVEDRGLRQRLSTRVLDMRFGEQSWRDIADATIAVYRKTLSQGTRTA